jgi:DNA-binding MarR family transcriptional regulator
MSRSGEDPREQTSQSGPNVTPNRAPSATARDHPQSDRGARHNARREVPDRDRSHRLRTSDWDTLRIVGTFRVVAERDLPQDTTSHDLRHLVEDHLLERRTGIVDNEPTHLIVLTEEGRSLLEQHRDDSPDDPRQQYHVGFVKPRELAHDVQYYRAFQDQAARVAAEGGRVTRVVLDYELKRDYQRFLNRPDHEDIHQDRHAFAETHHLPIVDGHLEIPDLRLEIETEDGRVEFRDLEIITEHYSRGQIAGKARAGFTLYRSGGNTRGGHPSDTDHLRWLK